MKNSRLLICLAQKGNLPSVASFGDKCCRCGVEVWRSFSSPEKADVMCVACGYKAIIKGEVQGLELPTPKQMDEIRPQDLN